MKKGIKCYNCNSLMKIRVIGVSIQCYVTEGSIKSFIDLEHERLAMSVNNTNDIYYCCSKCNAAKRITALELRKFLGRK